MQTIQEFIDKNEISMTSESVMKNPNFMNPSPDMRHYSVTLKMGDEEMTSYFSMGSALKNPPNASDVLNSLALESSDYENNPEYADWRNEYGYEHKKSVLKTFWAIRDNSKALESFLGNERYNDLLWNTESL